jgi:hypothetical protein
LTGGGARVSHRRVLTGSWSHLLRFKEREHYVDHLDARCRPEVIDMPGDQVLSVRESIHDPRRTADMISIAQHY